MDSILFDLPTSSRSDNGIIIICGTEGAGTTHVRHFLRQWLANLGIPSITFSTRDRCDEKSADIEERFTASHVLYSEYNDKFLAQVKKAQAQRNVIFLDVSVEHAVYLKLRYTEANYLFIHTSTHELRWRHRANRQGCAGPVEQCAKVVRQQCRYAELEFSPYQRILSVATCAGDVMTTDGLHKLEVEALASVEQKIYHWIIATKRTIRRKEPFETTQQLLPWGQQEG